MGECGYCLAQEEVKSIMYTRFVLVALTVALAGCTVSVETAPPPPPVLAPYPVCPLVETSKLDPALTPGCGSLTAIACPVYEVAKAGFATPPVDVYGPTTFGGYSFDPAIGGIWYYCLGTLDAGTDLPDAAFVTRCGDSGNYHDCP